MFLSIASSCVIAKPDTMYPLGGIYAAQAHCSQTTEPDVDHIKIAGNIIADMESTCTISRLRQQNDGIILFGTQCQNDVNPRTTSGFMYQLADKSILLDYGYGPAIWYACTKP